MIKDKRFSTMSSYLGMYTIFDDKERKPLGSREVIRLLEENEQLKRELKHIQDLISYHIEHQKTELGQKVLQKVICDHNEWLLGHKELQE